MKELNIEEVEKHGIESKHTIMDTGEKRFRQICTKDKTAYIRTESGIKGYWQNSHYHTSIRELYIVQKGKILFAQYKNNQLEITALNENDIIKTEPSIPHNVYMYPDTVTHTVKYGEINDYDWIACKDLDDILLSKSLDELEK